MQVIVSKEQVITTVLQSWSINIKGLNRFTVSKGRKEGLDKEKNDEDSKVKNKRTDGYRIWGVPTVLLFRWTVKLCKLSPISSVRVWHWRREDAIFLLQDSLTTVRHSALTCLTLAWPASAIHFTVTSTDLPPKRTRLPILILTSSPKFLFWMLLYLN